MLKEFKEFALKGNVVDLAVGVIIGGAFGKIIASLVTDIIMPLIGLIIGNVDFTNLFVVFGDGEFATLADAQAAGALTFNYGLFINNVINFLIVSFSIFMAIKWFNHLRPKKVEEPAPITTKKCTYCYEDVNIDATRCPHCTSELK
ncbi:MAG: large-conductance mechanosensitive channel protein MscL [Eubacteriaceae bacterium]|nr:large-conductance mechanosensitive channel protein MscL [Eubacteriaceae bacterium]